MKIINYKNWDKENQIRNKNVPAHIIMDEIWHWQVPTGKSLSILGSFFYMNWDKYSFCFRFFSGYGLQGNSNSKKKFILFSERMAIRKTYKLFGWKFKILKPCKLFKNEKIK